MVPNVTKEICARMLYLVVILIPGGSTFSSADAKITAEFTDLILPLYIFVHGTILFPRMITVHQIQ